MSKNSQIILFSVTVLNFNKSMPQFKKTKITCLDDIAELIVPYLCQRWVEHVFPFNWKATTQGRRQRLKDYFNVMSIFSIGNLLLDDGVWENYYRASLTCITIPLIRQISKYFWKNGSCLHNIFNNFLHKVAAVVDCKLQF